MRFFAVFIFCIAQNKGLDPDYGPEIQTESKGQNQMVLNMGVWHGDNNIQSKKEGSDQIQIPTVGAVIGKLKCLLFSLNGPVFLNLCLKQLASTTGQCLLNEAFSSCSSLVSKFKCSVSFTSDYFNLPSC